MGYGGHGEPFDGEEYLKQHLELLLVEMVMVVFQRLVLDRLVMVLMFIKFQMFPCKLQPIHLGTPGGIW